MSLMGSIVSFGISLLRRPQLALAVMTGACLKEPLFAC
jgi:hypothetical protein